MGVAGCNHDARSVSSMLSEPIMKAPPGATELGRFTEEASPATDAKAYILWASPQPKAAVIRYYRRAFQGKYGLRSSSAATPTGLEIGGRINRFNVIVHSDDTPYNPRIRDGRPLIDPVRSPPPGTRSFITVISSSP